MNDEEYWELLEEQHSHDVVMLPSQVEADTENNDEPDRSGNH